MEKFKVWAKRRRFYILAILVGAAVTPGAIQSAYEFRGYKAYGSEYLIILLLLLMVGIVETLMNLVKGEMQIGGSEPGNSKAKEDTENLS